MVAKIVKKSSKIVHESIKIVSQHGLMLVVNMNQHGAMLAPQHGLMLVVNMEPT